MSINVTNNKPVAVSPVYDSKITGRFVPDEFMKETLVRPLFTPLITGHNVTITDTAKNANLDEDDIASLIADCCGGVVNPESEKKCKSLYSKTLVSFNNNANVSIQNIFANQAATQEGLPAPTQLCVYTPTTDVIPACRQFLAGQCTYEKFFACLAYYARPYVLGFYFANEFAFEDFKKWVDAQHQTLAPLMSSDVNQLFADFQTLNLKSLTESIKVRDEDSDNNEEYSFARTIISLLMKYTGNISPAEFGVLPFEINELYCPHHIVFVNVEKHAHASAKRVADEWDLINKSVQMKVKINSNKKISRLTSVARNIKKIQGQAATSASNMYQSIAKAKLYKFKKSAMSPFDFSKAVSKIIAKMSQVNRSMNVYKSVKASFAKPNRRNPDDYNKQGKLVSTHYRPDIHIYLDTSGSISEDNYQDSIKACIRFARKLNVNLYFNSFSHELSQCSLIKTQNKTVKQTYAEFQKIPKVSGGTDYEQIWHYINKSKKRKRELSIIITDFEYWAPNKFVKHPKNLFYAPISNANWDSIVRYAESFCDSMVNIDPNCRKHILF